MYCLQCSSPRISLTYNKLFWCLQWNYISYCSAIYKSITSSNIAAPTLLYRWNYCKDQRTKFPLLLLNAFWMLLGPATVKGLNSTKLFLHQQPVFSQIFFEQLIKVYFDMERILMLTIPCQFIMVPGRVTIIQPLLLNIISCYFIF